MQMSIRVSKMKKEVFKEVWLLAAPLLFCIISLVVKIA